jgi:hypothetical protein
MLCVVFDQVEQDRPPPSHHLVPAKRFLAAALIEPEEIFGGVEVFRVGLDSSFERRGLLRGHARRSLPPRGGLGLSSVLFHPLGIGLERFDALLTRQTRGRNSDQPDSEGDRCATRRVMPRIAANDAVEPRFESSPSADTDVWPGQAPPVQPNGVGDVEQETRVGLRTRDSPAERGVVARLLGGGRDRTIQPPRQWMEPEDAAIQLGDERHERVASPDVSRLVDERRLEVCRRPRGPRRGQ